MLKSFTYIFVGIVFLLGLTAGKAHADTGICGYISQNPTVSQAENYIIAAAEVVVKYDLNGNAVGEEIASDVVRICPQYINIVLQATENLGG